MIESVQYNAALANTGAIHGSSRDKLYQELGFESLHDRRWFRKLCFYYKILYGSDSHNLSMNKIIISTVIDFTIQSKRFEDPLIQ